MEKNILSQQFWSLEEIKNKNIHNLVLCCRPFWLFALNYFFKLKSSYHIGNEKIWLDQLFTNKSFMLDEIFHHNASKFWYYYYTENNMWVCQMYGKFWSISLESLGSSINLLISEECKYAMQCMISIFIIKVSEITNNLQEAKIRDCVFSLDLHLQLS